MNEADLKLLRIFAAVVEAGGLSPAQSELNLALSTISGRISDLESRLGLRLCTRGRAGFSLTPEGSAVYEEARKLFASVENFDRQVRRLGTSVAGNLNLGITDNTLTDPQSRLDAVIARFCAGAPEVTLSIVTRPPNELIRDVVAGTLHLAIASFPRQSLGLEYVDLYSEHHHFYCGRAHPLFAVRETEIDIGRVREYPMVARAYWGARDLKVFAVAAPRAVVSDMEAEARLILSGRFLGFLPSHYARSHVAAGRMRSLRPDLFAYDAPFQLVYNAERVNWQPLSMMLSAVMAEMAAPARDSGRPRWPS